MQNFVWAIAMIFLLSSCSEDEPTLTSCTEKVDIASLQFPQTWKLVKMTGSMINTETTGANMDWQETILLNADGTFTKTRDRNNETVEASGTYSFALTADLKIAELTLTYPSENNLIGSCYGLLIEKYLLFTQCKLTGTWSHCDGPGLEYEKQ
jgi:hypothetical protein